ncbi:MAG: YraN family protein [Magnetococcus sp. DMHC-6]
MLLKIFNKIYLGNRKAFGLYAEEMAANHLIRTGYHILERNKRFRQGELDIVALHKEYLVFCEVKARRSQTQESAAEAIDTFKQNRLMLLAELYRQAHPEYQDHPCRFDAVLITLNGNDWLVEIIPNAFP